MGASTGLVKLLEEQVVESDSGSHEVGEQRERNHRYYSMQPLGNEQEGRSHYIDPSVYDAVEGKKALFSETFLSSRQTVKFKSAGMGTPFEAEAKTAYVNKVLKENNHSQLFKDGWHDAFVAKRMVVFAEWMDDTEDIELSVNGMMLPQLQQLIQQQGQVVGVDDSQLQVQNMPTVQGIVPVINGMLTVTIASGSVSLTLVQPERFYRDPEASYPQDSQWCAMERDVSRGTLLLEGFDPEQVKGLSVDYRFRSDEEDSARKAHDQSWTQRRKYNRSDHQQQITVYKTVTWLDFSGDMTDYGLTDSEMLPEGITEGLKLYEIDWAHGEILIKNGSYSLRETDYINFYEWSEVKVAHAEFGLCTADVEAHTQKSASVLKRLVIDNQQMRNNTRYEAVINSLKNPRDLLDSKIGGVVWSRAIGSVAPLATPELSPLTMSALDMIRADSERRDGYSSLGKGTNGDALRFQNSENMIDKLTQAGTRRPMMAARDWALTFLVPLCQCIVRMAMQYDQSASQGEAGGREIQIMPSQWADQELDMDVTVALTPDEGQKMAQQLLTMHSVWSQDPDMAGLYGVNQKHALMDAVMDGMGISDSTPYMMRPDSPEFQQMQQQQQQQMQEQAQKQDELTLVQMDLAKSADQRAWDQHEFTKLQTLEASSDRDAEFEHKKSDDDRNYWLDVDKFEHESRIDQAEVNLEREQKRPVSVSN